jgi:hypothetical protein
MFQKGGKLQDYDLRRMHYEIIVTRLKTPSVKSILQRYFKPKYNQRIQAVSRLNAAQQRRAIAILTAYRSQSRFTPLERMEGEHKTDSKHPFTP